MSVRTRTLALTGTVMTALLALTACSGTSADPSTSDKPKEEIVVTCATCQESPTDPFLQFNYEAATRFNEQYKGQYRIEMLNNANAGSSKDRLQYYQRLALADDLPDIFQLNSAEIAELSTTGKLHDFAGDLKADKTWSDTFLPGSFDALTGKGGETWAIPQQRDPIGIFWNKALWESVGYDEFPATWDEFEKGAAKLKDQGKVALALDGDWATMLAWTNLIGTNAGGVDFLTKGITKDDWADDKAVVAATERLAEWHEKGWVNSDAFSGDFNNASAAYLSQDAASVPNGPWFVKTKLNTEAASPGLYDGTGYSVSPGWKKGQQGVIVVSGAGWVSGTTDKTKLEAVDAFMKFVSSTDEVLAQAKETGANPAIEVPTDKLKGAGLEPLSEGLATAAADVELQYPHVRVFGPAGFGNAWKNLWPAYVKGEMSTKDFLTRLSADSTAGA